jgi:hypothetical protein
MVMGFVKHIFPAAAALLISYQARHRFKLLTFIGPVGPEVTAVMLLKPAPQAQNFMIQVSR